VYFVQILGVYGDKTLFCVSYFTGDFIFNSSVKYPSDREPIFVF
jgi:hypothetical protein